MLYFVIIYHWPLVLVDCIFMVSDGAFVLFWSFICFLELWMLGIKIFLVLLLMYHNCSNCTICYVSWHWHLLLWYNILIRTQIHDNLNDVHFIILQLLLNLNCTVSTCSIVFVVDIKHFDDNVILVIIYCLCVLLLVKFWLSSSLHFWFCCYCSPKVILLMLMPYCCWNLNFLIKHQLHVLSLLLVVNGKWIQCCC